MEMWLRTMALSGAVLLMTGCGGLGIVPVPKGPVALNQKESQLQTRQYQSRKYRVHSKVLMRSVIDTLQDDNFIIRHTDNDNGIVTASKYQEEYKLEVSARIKHVMQGQCELRMNVLMVESNAFGAERSSALKKKYYQYLFSRIEKSLFVEQNLYGSAAAAPRQNAWGASQRPVSKQPTRRSRRRWRRRCRTPISNTSIIQKLSTAVLRVLNYSARPS